MSWKICIAPNIGQTTTAQNGYLVRKISTLEIPVHPQTSSRGHWVMGAPMTKYVIEFEPVGQIEIPSGSVLSAKIFDAYTVGGSDYILVQISALFDISTGDCRFEFGICTGTVSGVNTFTTFDILTHNCAVPVPVHQTMQDAMTFRQARRANQNLQIDAVRGFVDSILNLDVGSAISVGQKVNMEAKANIDDATNANKVTVSGEGANGSYMSFNIDLCTPKCICYFTSLVEEYNADKGRPLCKTKVINTLSGYIQCDNPDIRTTGTQAENERILSYLTGGFFYE